MKHQIDPFKTDYSKFSTGNIKTLSYGDVDKFGHVLAASIRDFHRRYYSSDRMTLSLVGPQTIEQLSNLAAEMFADIPMAQAAEADADVAANLGTVLCMYMYLCTCMYFLDAHLCIYVTLFVYEKRLYVYIFMCVCMYVCMYVCVHIYIQMHIHTIITINIHIPLYIQYKHIHIYTNIYIHTVQH